MPYYSNYSRDEEKDGAAGQGQATENGTFQRAAASSDQSNSVPSGSGTLSNNSGAVQGASEANAAKTGSQYQNLDSYLGANSDSNFGNQVAEKLVGSQNKGAQDQQKAAQGFAGQVYQANYVPTESDIGGALANPATANPAQYQTWMNQTYQGPKALSDSASLQNDYWNSTKKAVNETGQISGNDTGQFSLINSYFGSPVGSSSYSSNNGPTGEQALDLSLAQNTANYGNVVQDLRQRGANLNQQAQNGVSALSNVASSQAGNVANAANAARAAVGIDQNGQIIQGPGAGAIGQLEGTINQGVTDANTKNAADTAALKSKLSTGDISGLTPDQLALFGLNSGQDTYGRDLSKYVTSGPALTAANTMTPEQLSQLKALQGLAGISNDTLGSTTLAKASPYQVDTAGVKNELTSGKNAKDASDYQSAKSSTNIFIPPTGLPGGGLFGTGIGGRNQSEGQTLPLADLEILTKSFIDGSIYKDPKLQALAKKNNLDTVISDASLMKSWAEQAQPYVNQQIAALKKKYNQT